MATHRLLDSELIDPSVRHDRSAPSADTWHLELCLDRFDAAYLDTVTVTLTRGLCHSGGDRPVYLHCMSNCYAMRNRNNPTQLVPGQPEIVKLRDLIAGKLAGPFCQSCWATTNLITHVRRQVRRLAHEAALEKCRKVVAQNSGRVERSRTSTGLIRTRKQTFELHAALVDRTMDGASLDQDDERDRLIGELAKIVAAADARLGDEADQVIKSVETKIRAELGVGDAALDEQLMIVAGRVRAFDSNETARLAVTAFKVASTKDVLLLRCPAFVWAWLASKERVTHRAVRATAIPDETVDDEVLQTAVSLYATTPGSPLCTAAAAIDTARQIHS